MAAKYLQALKRRANAKYITLDFDGAVADYTKALKYDWQNARLYFSRGLAYTHVNKLDNAAQDFYKAHTLDENNQEYTDNLSQVSANPKATDKITRLEFSEYK